MKSFERWFIALVIVADFAAIVYFGGNYLLHGTLGSPKKEHHDVIVAEESHTPKKAAPAFDLASYTPNVTKGQKIAGKCKACHTFDKGGKNRIGPNLWNISGAPIAEDKSFAYSAAFKEKIGQLTWDDATMHGYLKKPGKFIPGTKMAFPGIKKPADRADLISWLETLK